MEELTRTASGSGVHAHLGGPACGGPGLFSPERQPSASAPPLSGRCARLQPGLPRGCPCPLHVCSMPRRWLDTQLLLTPTCHAWAGSRAPCSRQCPRSPTSTLHLALSSQPPPGMVASSRAEQELLTLPADFCAASGLHSGAASSRTPPLIFLPSASGGPRAPSLPIQSSESVIHHVCVVVHCQVPRWTDTEDTALPALPHQGPPPPPSSELDAWIRPSTEAVGVSEQAGVRGSCEERLEGDALAPLRSRVGLSAGHSGAGTCQTWQKPGPSGGMAGWRGALLAECAFQGPVPAAAGPGAISYVNWLIHLSSG